jgi:hypothetical protein
MRMSEGYMKRLRWMLMLAALGSAATGFGQQSAGKDAGSPPAVAQEQDDRTFLVSFVARELDENGKVVNSRRYDTMTGLMNGRGSTIRTGAKVPVTVIGKSGTDEMVYVDVGVSFDVNHPRIVNGNHLAMQVKCEISSLDPATRDPSKPMIRQNVWTGDVVVPVGEHKVIFSSDDLASKRTMQIEVTVTRVN